jgi:hypothetical protein
MSDMDTDLDFEPDEDRTGRPPERRAAGGMSGEYRDPANYGLLAAAVVIGGFFLAIDLGIGVWRNPAVLVFSLLFPSVAVLVALHALTVVTLGFDGSGWRYRRELFGHVRETEEARWSDIAQTAFRQWARGGTRSSNSFTVFGELSLWDSSGKAVLRAQTTFYERGNPGAAHDPGKRQIGLSQDDFRNFVRLINDETPQVGYEWVESDANAEPPRSRFTFMLADPGPDRYVRVPRGSRTSDSVHLPTPF